MAIDIELPVVATIYTLVNRIRRIVPRPMVPMGQVWWLNVGHTAAADRPDYGTDPDHPFKTLLYALTRCVSGRGDILVVAGGSYGTIADHSTYNTAIDGLTIYGLGNIWYGPPFYIGGNSGDNYLEITGDDVTIFNVRMMANYTTPNLAKRAFVLSGLRNALICCNIQCAAASETTKFIDEAAVEIKADGARVIGCQVDAGGDPFGGAAWPENGILISEDVDDVAIIANNFAPAFTDGVIYQASGKTATNLVIVRNYMYNAKEETNHRGLVRLEGTATGVIEDIRGYGYDSVGSTVLIYPDDCAPNQCYVNHAAGASGVLRP